MKVLLVLSFILVGCELPKKDGEVVSSYVSVKEKQKYEGIYYFDNGSSFEIQSNELDEMFVYTTGQSVKTVNGDSTLSFHPTISGTRLREVNGELFWSANVNYAVANNTKEDVSNVVLNGSKLTEFHFKFIGGNPTLRIVIYSSNVVVVDRSIDELN